MIRIAVIDGQGGGIGATVIKRIKEVYGERVEVWALGTNAIATSQMMKAGANRGATGENAVFVFDFLGAQFEIGDINHDRAGGRDRFRPQSSHPVACPPAYPRG